MSDVFSTVSRRGLLKGATAVAGAAALGSFPLRQAKADKFPSKSMRVAIPTGEGGGVDDAARAFTNVWAEKLGASFEYSYYPGASGQVGYEIFVKKLESDCHTLLFGNIGPEMIMYGTQNPGYKFPDDYVYFASIDADDAVIWVAKNSKFQTIEALVEEGKKRTINFSTSRLPHPSSLGVLALAEATGAKFKLVPYGGGNAARSAAITGECDACATFMNSSLKFADQIKFLTVFQNKNRVPDKSNNAPPVNSVFGSKIPSMTGNRAWAIQTKAIKEYPERYELLKKTAKETFNDPAYRKAVEKGKNLWEFNEYTEEAECTASAKEVVLLAQKYKDLISATK
ncbi:MAG: twin-arginine translocation signal domain-containing protein [Rhodospirillales bacterium]|nr:twin-arginine translocation signal domain-containing protein [Rhodospirillales bacterium]